VLLISCSANRPLRCITEREERVISCGFVRRVILKDLIVEASLYYIECSAGVI
jgi:hypothetical protein